MLFIYLLIGLLLSKISLEILYKIKPKLAINILKVIRLCIFKIIALYAIISVLLYKQIKDIRFAYVFITLIAIGCLPMMFTFHKNKIEYNRMDY